MKNTCLLIVLLCMILNASAQQGGNNRYDDKKRKTGPWVEMVESVRGEPGYSWEGEYKAGKKEGVWKKFTVNGDVLAEETFKNGALDGLCKYYYPDGKVSAVGMMLAVDLDGQKDTVLVVDPVTGEEKFTEITRKGNSVRQGEWRLYDEDGTMMKETYERGEISKSEMGAPRRNNAAPLPHEQQAGKKKKN